MIIILHHKVPDTQINLIEHLIQRTGYPTYTIIDIDTIEADKIPDILDLLVNNKLIMIYNETKTKNAFHKQMEAIFGNDIFERLSHAIRIDKPASIDSQKDTIAALWSSIQDITKYNIKEFNIADLPKNITNFLNEIVIANKHKKVFVITDNLGKNLEVRPDSVKPTLSVSLTYSEFMILVAAKYTFNLDKISIGDLHDKKSN